MRATKCAFALDRTSVRTNAGASTSRSNRAVPPRSSTSPRPRRRDFIALSLTLVALRDDEARAQTNARALMEPEGTIETGLTANARIRACPREHNCVSTSARESDKYASPWTAPNTFRDVKSTANALVDAVLDTVDGSKLVQRDDRKDGTYLGFKAPGKLGEDVIEFFVKSDEVKDRGWEGDEGNGSLILYRSFALDVKYVYPFMTPIGDLGEQAKRLGRIRQELGARQLGCELVERFS